jgi:hypothetical protein
MRDISLETVIVALTYIDAHDRDTWLKVGNALKTEFGYKLLLMCLITGVKQPITTMQSR